MEPIIEIIQSNWHTQLEGRILKAVAGVDVHVNKERLLKALSDAKSFYEEGYKAGKKDAVLHGHWEKSEDDWFNLHIIKCSLCGEEWCFEEGDVVAMYYKHCPNCGASMDGDCDEH